MDSKIYTKTGDKGETSLIGGRMVPKYDPQIEAYGTVDELNSFIGLLRDETVDQPVRDALLRIQEQLFVVEALLAEDKTFSGREKGKRIPLPELKEEEVQFLEKEIDNMSAGLPPLNSFVLPGGHRQSSLSHLSRTVCRRAERAVIWLARETPVDPLVIKYLNRLSDYFFILARMLNYANGGEEMKWKTRD